MSELRAEKIVLLDVGGVLFPDPWETLLLESSLADTLGVSRRVLEAVGQALWTEIATHPDRSLAWWWEAVEARLECRIPREVVEDAELLLTPVEGAHALIEAAGEEVGVISNSTAFWWPVQCELLEWEPPAALSFLSHERGLEKSQGLFELARAELEGAVLVVDDRPSNIQRAEAVGFEALYHPALGDLTPTISAVEAWLAR